MDEEDIIYDKFVSIDDILLIYTSEVDSVHTCITILNSYTGTNHWEFVFSIATFIYATVTTERL